MNYEWKIEGVQVDDGLITAAKYYCRAINRSGIVDTEGTWFFKDPQLVTLIADVTEEMVVEWIKGQANIEGRLAEQMDNLAAQVPMSLPWSPPVFTPKFEE